MKTIAVPPVEPTDEMLQAAYRVYVEAADKQHYVAWRNVRECIEAALAAAPPQSEPTGATVRCRKCGTVNEVEFHYGKPTNAAPEQAKRGRIEVCLGQTPEDYGKDAVALRRLQSSAQDYFDGALKNKLARYETAGQGLPEEPAEPIHHPAFERYAAELHDYAVAQTMRADENERDAAIVRWLHEVAPNTVAQWRLQITEGTAPNLAVGTGSQTLSIKNLATNKAAFKEQT